MIRRILVALTPTIISGLMAGSCIVIGGGVALATAEYMSACTPGVTPSSAWQALVTDVKAGLAANDTLAQLVDIVARDLQSDVNPTVYLVLSDLLSFFEDAVGVASALAEDKMIAGRALAIHPAVKLQLSVYKAQQAQGVWP